MISIRSYAKALVTAAALALLTTGSTVHAQDKPDITGRHGFFTVTCLSIPDIGRGAGLALILQTPEGHTYLYDTGSGYPTTADASGWVRNFNAGRDLIDPFLRKHHIKKIDGIAISHAHWDHYGGLIWLIDHYKIGKVYDSGYDIPGPVPPEWQLELHGYSELRNRFKKLGIYQKVAAGDKLPWDKQLDVEVIAPPQRLFSRTEAGSLSQKRHPCTPPRECQLAGNSHPSWESRLPIPRRHSGCGSGCKPAPHCSSRKT